jgi:antirestriction protein ArdC
VHRGERGIRIIVPMRRKANEQDTTEESRLFFGTGTVFDVAQTEGEPLPEVMVPTLEGESGGGLMDALLELAGREGVAVQLDRGELPSAAMGAYWADGKHIRFRAAPMRQMVKTLAHELGHHVHLTRFGEEPRVEAERETVAESVAYVVCGKYGIDTGERSFKYIATWAQDGQTLRNAMGTIQKVSAAIIDGIEGSRAMAAVEVRTP